MTMDEVKARLEKIRVAAAAGDAEVAFGEEFELYRALCRHYAGAGHALATAALEASTFHFPRYTS